MRRILFLLLALCALCGLSGCLALNSAELLTLPEISPEHRELLKLFNAVTASSDWVTTNPVAGNNKLTTQFVDIYQDGIPEALAFFKNPTDLKLRLTVYTKTGKASYGELCSIEIPGEQFHRIDCVDVNGDGSQELVVGVRYATSAMYGLNVYTLKNGEGVELLDTSYTDLTVFDLTDDGVADIVTMNSDENGINSFAELFTRAGSGLASAGRAPLSAAVRAPSAIVTGRLNDSMCAVVAEGSFLDAAGATRYLSDVLIWRDSALTNLSYAEIYHQSFETQRSVSLRFGDINFDGAMEFPIALTMPQPPTVNVAGGTYVRWFGYTANGEVKAVADTYHASDNRWYVQMPQAWNDRVYVYVETGNGYRAGVFATELNGQQYTLMKLYLFSSESALKKYEAEDLISLPEFNDVFYAATVTAAAELPEALVPLAIDAAEVAERLVFVSANGYRRASANR